MSVFTFEKEGAPRLDPARFFGTLSQRSLATLAAQAHVVGLEEDGSPTKIVYGFFFTDRWKPRKAWSLPFFGRKLELLYVLQAANEALTSPETKSRFLLRKSTAHLRKAVREILNPALPADGYARGAALQTLTQSELAAYYYATRKDGPFGPGLLPGPGQELDFFLLGFEGDGEERRLTVSKFDLPPLFQPPTTGNR